MKFRPIKNRQLNLATYTKKFTWGSWFYYKYQNNKCFTLNESKKIWHDSLPERGTGEIDISEEEINNYIKNLPI